MTIVQEAATRGHFSCAVPDRRYGRDEAATHEGGFSVHHSTEAECYWEYRGLDGTQHSGQIPRAGGLGSIVRSLNALCDRLEGRVVLEVPWTVRRGAELAREHPGRSTAGQSSYRKLASRLARRLELHDCEDERRDAVLVVAEQHGAWKAWREILESPGPEIPRGRVLVATDGSHSYQVGCGTWGWYVSESCFDVGVMEGGSSTFYETAAIYHAALAAAEGCELSIVSDCLGVIRALGYQANGRPLTRTYEACSDEAEQALREMTRELLADKGVNLRWVKAHKRHGLNRKVDMKVREALRAYVGRPS
jgi:ribonuclease HI